MNFSALIRLCRPHQWSKNVLVLLPLVASHQTGNLSLLRLALLAMIAFSMTASGVYAFNDAADAESDRHHPTKKFRPVASGAVTESQAYAVSFLMLSCGASVAGSINLQALGCLLVYVFFNVLYTRFLKKLIFMDVLCLTGFYLLRIALGHAATGVKYSPWLLAFALFLFLSLALMKRSSELLRWRVEEKNRSSDRGYILTDLPIINQFGSSSGMMSVLVLALYIDRGAAEHGHYNSPWVLWLLCPVVLYWLGRAWLLTGRGRMHDDPVLFALTDRVSLITAVFAVLVFYLASVGIPH